MQVYDVVSSGWTPYSFAPAKTLDPKFSLCIVYRKHYDLVVASPPPPIIMEGPGGFSVGGNPNQWNII